MLPSSVVTAEEGIPAGSGAVITAGAPLAVRTAPGWDAAVAYEIADGSAVTVWESAQAAPDGSLWYPVDGGFVPVDAVSSVAILKGDVALYQDATQDAATGDGVEPATVDPAVAGAAAQDQAGIAPAPTEEGVEPAASETAPETTSKEALADPGRRGRSRGRRSDRPGAGGSACCAVGSIRPPVSGDRQLRAGTPAQYDRRRSGARPE